MLYDPTDLDVQFRLLRNSRLTLSDIQSILKALRAIKTRDRAGEEIIATTGEILRQFPDQQRIDPEAHDADTKVRTAIAWLEEAQILERHENHTQVLPASLLVATVEEARTRLLHKLKDAALLPDYLSIVTALMNCADDDSLSTDELMGLTGKDARTDPVVVQESLEATHRLPVTDEGVVIDSQRQRPPQPRVKCPTGMYLIADPTNQGKGTGIATHHRRNVESSESDRRRLDTDFQIIGAIDHGIFGVVRHRPEDVGQQ